ncbi:hypothetical protein [Coleofasciculus sp. F4-SAH-05]
MTREKKNSAVHSCAEAIAKVGQGESAIASASTLPNRLKFPSPRIRHRWL